MLKNTEAINVISKLRRLYAKKHQRYYLKKIFFAEAVRHSCSIRLVPTYILPAKDIRPWESFSPIAFKLRD